MASFELNAVLFRLDIFLCFVRLSALRKCISCSTVNPFASLLNVVNLLKHFRLGNMIICHLVLLFCLHNHQVQLFAQLVKICENQMTEKEVREKVATTTSAS